MKLSEKNLMRLYNAIHEPIIEVRIKHKDEDVERELFYTENQIWRNVKAVLNIKE